MRPDSFDASVSLDALSVLSAAGLSAGMSRSQIRFSTPGMSRVPLVIAMTASYCGRMMQYWPNAPSPR